MNRTLAVQFQFKLSCLRKLQLYYTQYFGFMSDIKSISLWDVGKIAGIAAVSVALNHLIQTKLLNRKVIKKPTFEQEEDDVLPPLPSLMQIDSMLSIGDEPVTANDLWGSMRLMEIAPTDALLIELQMMTRLMCPFQKVNNLIVDLQLYDVKTYPCPLVAHQIKRQKHQPFLSAASLVKPGQFVIQNCVFRAGQSIETEKKFMRAGPRSTQYFHAKDVRADIVIAGKVAPGINNIVRQLVVLLKEIYKVESVTGVRFGCKGFYDDDIIALTSELVATIHHRGGSFIGVSSVPFQPVKVVDNLELRRINHLYVVGGNDTLKNASQLYKEIKRRRLNIAFCVILKAINKDIAVFDSCFGFQSAVEESQRFLQEAYALSKSNYNTAVTLKVPGRFSGFLAMDASLSARNVNICLVPEFQYDLYGERGLLRYISDRIKLKGHCIIVYSEGAAYAARDIPIQQQDKIFQIKDGIQHVSFDHFFKLQIQKQLNANKVENPKVFTFDTMNAVRTVPANSFDTKLCAQIALCSIQGLMCGYTNFAIGHLKNRVAMVPLDQTLSNHKYCLKPSDENWQRLLATTGQPSFINDEAIDSE